METREAPAPWSQVTINSTYMNSMLPGNDKIVVLQRHARLCMIYETLQNYHHDTWLL
jgi:hypothetical protein